MDGQRRIVQFQGVQSIPQPTPSGSEFSQDSKGKGVNFIPMESTSVHSMNNAMLDIDDSSLADYLSNGMMPTSHELPNAQEFGQTFASDAANVSGHTVANNNLRCHLDGICFQPVESKEALFVSC
jgi:hypothetical protein